MIPAPIRQALDLLEADLRRYHQDALAGADILMDDIPARLQAICEVAPDLGTEERLGIANRLDIIYNILDDIAVVLHPL